MSRYTVATLRWGDEVFGLVAGDEGLREIVLPCQWVNPSYPARALLQDSAALRPYIAELEEYFSGQRRNWTIALDLQGTPFQVSVWRALQEIPYGTVVTYGEVARRIGRPNAVRAVAAAIGRNPLPLVVPCHRVIGADNTLTGYRGGLELKQRLLRLEGIHGVMPMGHPRFAF